MEKPERKSDIGLPSDNYADDQRRSALNIMEDAVRARREAEKLNVELRDSEMRYRRLFEAARDGILILDAETAQITDANPFIAELLGYRSAALMGKELWQLGFFKDAEANKAAMNELKTKRYIRYDNLPLETKTGGRIDVEFISSMYEEGDHLLIQCNIRDVSERKRLEEDLRKRNEELAAADRSKNQFIAMLSHELRSPLNAIRGWIQILMSPGAKAEDLRTGLSVIDRNSKLQAELISDLLDIHRIASGKIRLEFAAVDLREVIDSAIDAIGPAAAAKAIEIEREMDSTPVIISGDSARLQQVLSNLLGNAIKFTPKGGRILIALRAVDLHAEVVVSDTGQGIIAAALPGIFERFRQGNYPTNRSEGGLGLGLAISKQLVELHGGTISAGSLGAGQGSTFTISLPTVTADTVRPLAGTDKGEEESGSLDGILVLVVDDEADAREPLQKALERAGAETIAVASVGEALAVIEHRPPDVIVSDIAMPGRDGYDLVRSVGVLLATRGKRVPAIALTAYAATEDRDRAMSAGFQKHMTKPVEQAELIAAVAALAASGQADRHFTR
jgi:PAS domain S-box-containing protein